MWTNRDFREWKERLALTFPSAAEALGLALRTVKGYADDAQVPLVVELACHELERRYHETPYRSGDYLVNLPGRTVDHVHTGAHWTIDANGPTLRRQGQLQSRLVTQMTLDAARAYRESHRNAEAAGAFF